MKKAVWAGAVVGFLLGLLAGGAIIQSLYAVPYAMAGDYWAWKDRMYLWKQGWRDGLAHMRLNRGED